jgi:hypothetical protein
LPVLMVVFMAASMPVFVPDRGEARPDTRSMTCGQLLSFVDRHGAVVLNTGQYTYKRLVAHRGYCLYSETAETVWVPGRNGVQCALRECEDHELRRRRRHGR